MPHRIDVSRFQPITEIDAGDDEETALLKDLATSAEALAPRLNGMPPVDRIYLAFGVGGIVGVFFASLRRPADNQYRNQAYWMVVGDLPSFALGDDSASTPSEVLRIYCDVMEDWAHKVLAGADLSSCYFVAADPTEEHAHMLLDRTEFLRTEYVPIADDGPIRDDSEEAAAEE